jgi:hypothetical protein
MTNRTRLVSGRVPVSNSSNVASDRYQYLDLSSAEPNLGTSDNGNVLTYNSGSPGQRLWITQASIIAPAFDKANAVNTYAQQVYDASNNVNTFAQGAYNVANSASSNTIYSQGVNDTQNTSITAVNTFAQSSYTKANTVGILAQAAFDAANVAAVSATDVYARQTANAAYAQANSANVLAQAGFNVANTAYTNTLYMEGVNNTQNTLISSAQSNTIILQGVTDTINTNSALITQQAGAAFDKANSANILAQAAFNYANTLSTGGGGAFLGGNVANPIIINANTDSVGINTGSMIVVGGASVSGNLYARELHITSNNGITFADGTIQNLAANIAAKIYTYVLDDLTAQFDGSTTVFKLTYTDGANTNAVLPGNPAQLDINIGGIKVYPTNRIFDYVNLTDISSFTTGFYLANDEIVFATAPTPSLKFYGTFTSNETLPNTFRFIQTPFSALNIMLGT